MFFIDQVGNRIILDSIPKRIISLVPSQTEFLYDIGLENSIVGITKFCIHPKDFFKKTNKIGGTKDFRFDIIDNLQPDLIIANKEENYKEGIEKLQKKYKVWISDIITLQDNYEMMSEIGKMTNKMVEANKIISIIQTDLAKLIPLNVEKAKKVLYLIWQDPFMAAGKNTFIDVMLQVAGFENVTKQNRYPELTSNEIQNMQPDYVFLSSEPYPFKEKHISYFQKLCPKTKIILVDGELFSWYGSRLKHSAKYFQQLEKQL
jgi:ABC-type Fe3+-hydroxamate transport system substrate-binding protein